MGEPKALTAWCRGMPHALYPGEAEGFLDFLRYDATPEADPVLVVLDGGGEATGDRALLSALPEDGAP